MMNDAFQLARPSIREGMRYCIKIIILSDQTHCPKNTVLHIRPSTRKFQNASTKKMFTLDVEFEDRTQDLFRVKEAA
jgi:hypothetical protein